MHRKLILLLLLLITVIGIFEVPAQSLVLKTKDGTEKIKQLTTLKKFTFSNNKLLVNYADGLVDTYNLSSISKLYFKSGVTSLGKIDATETTKSISIFPNPVDHILYIKNAPINITTASIYQMNGVLILTAQIASVNRSIDVSFLTSGIYIIKVDNQVLKFIKR